MRVSSCFGSVLLLLLVSVSGGDAFAQERLSGRTFAVALSSAEWVTVGEGFVLRLYSDQEVKAIMERRAPYEKRRAEYLTKVGPHAKQLDAIESGFPASSLQAARMIASRYDRNKDGILDQTEQRSIRGNVDYDRNEDGEITTSEIVRYFLQRSQRVLPENWEQTLDEWEVLDDKKREVDKEYQDVVSQRSNTRYYRVMEVGKDFIRIRHEERERLIPWTSIREVERKAVD